MHPLLRLQHELHRMVGFTRSGRRGVTQIWEQATGRWENKAASLLLRVWCLTQTIRCLVLRQWSALGALGRMSLVMVRGWRGSIHLEAGGPRD